MCAKRKSGGVKTFTADEVRYFEFEGIQIPVVQFEGKAYFAVKPVVEGLGKRWENEYRRISKDSALSKRKVNFTIPTENSGIQEFVMMELESFEGWIFSIPLSKRFRESHPEAAKKLDKFREDGYKALHSFVTHGYAVAGPDGSVEDITDPMRAVLALVHKMDERMNRFQCQLLQMFERRDIGNPLTDSNTPRLGYQVTHIPTVWQLPAPAVAPPSHRKAIQAILFAENCRLRDREVQMRQAAGRDDMSDIEDDMWMSFLWGQVNSAVYQRKGKNLTVKAKNAGVSRPEIAEREGWIDELYTIVCEVVKELKATYPSPAPTDMR